MRLRKTIAPAASKPARLQTFLSKIDAEDVNAHTFVAGIMAAASEGGRIIPLHHAMADTRLDCAGSKMNS